MKVDGEGVPGDEVVVVGVVERGIRVELAFASWVRDMGSKMELKVVVECSWGIACLIERGRWRAKKEEAATSEGCRCSVFGTAGSFPPTPPFPHDSPSNPLENPVFLFAGEDG